MPIHPLPQFEADLEADRKAYERLKAPTSIVVRFGRMKLVGEFPYSGDAKPGCGSKMIVRTHRGLELGEMLTSTCPNAGCSKSVTRKDMLEYIENSGGRDYPFFNQGRVLRVASAEDLNRQTLLDASRPRLVMEARAHAAALGLPMKIVDAEPILGGERLTYYFTSEDRIDFRDLVSKLAAEQRSRIDMRQVGARDEARLTADYERCGQHCCCKQFLKVLKPVSMRSAKVQKATLDPLKISGRCGRLMCCLRYEDESYEELRKRLPRKKSRVLTPDGWGIVMDTQILTQLALVKLEETGAEVAVPVEELDGGARSSDARDEPEHGVDGGDREDAVEPSAGAGRADAGAPTEARLARGDNAGARPQGPDPTGTRQGQKGPPPDGGRRGDRDQRRQDRPVRPARPDRPPQTHEAPPLPPVEPPNPTSERSSAPPGQAPQDQARDPRRRRRRRRPGGGNRPPSSGEGPGKTP